jgi:hypothetical protein
VPVTDLDFWPRGLPREWRAVERLVRRAAEVGALEDEIAQATARTLRRLGGCPALAELRGRAGLLDEPPTVWDAESERLRREHPHPTTEILIDSLTVLRERSPLLGAEFPLSLSEQIVRRLSRRFETRAYLAADADPECATQLRDQDASFLARQLAARPDGSALRAPKRTGRRLSTQELLDQPLLGPADA